MGVIEWVSVGIGIGIVIAIVGGYWFARAAGKALVEQEENGSKKKSSEPVRRVSVAVVRSPA